MWVSPPVPGQTGIRFKIYPDGRAKELVLEHPSGDVSLDRAAWGGITGSSPYQPLPKQFTGPYLELRFGFHYNLPERDRRFIRERSKTASLQWAHDNSAFFRATQSVLHIGLDPEFTVPGFT